VISAVALVAGLAGGLAGWVLLRSLLANPVFERSNYRGHRLPTASGLVIVLAMLLAQAWYTLLMVLGVERAAEGAFSRSLALLAATGFGFLGLLDDLAGSEGDRGFGGHVGATGRGEVTTGFLKLVGGGLLAAVLAGAVAGEDVTGFLARLLVIGLAANLGNLLDHAPGRVIKVAVLALVVLAAVTGVQPDLAGPALLVGASLALLLPDLHEVCMLGDTGANVLGAALGLGVALAAGTAANLVVAVVLLALNLVSERVSFSAVIDATPPLRWFDRLGAPYRGDRPPG
jgi:UDP-N-acetylmuramyl pentapeptide phosphotransferase/UDP-N-acetylglucosamine-1-phosphate transferase